MKDDFAQQAISSALSGDWEKAVSLNKSVLEEDPKDVLALNRLARAYAELGKMADARRFAKKVLKIDPFNTIALKSLKRWRGLKRGDSTGTSNTSSPEAFLEEPGKTIIIGLIHLGAGKTIAKLDAGDKVILNPKQHRISITSQDKKYVGRLPDDLSARIRKLARFGNKYEAFIKSIDEGKVKVLIREVKRGPKLKEVPSFPSEKIEYVSFTPPDLVHKAGKPEASNQEEA